MTHPLTPSDSDLRGLPFMPMDVVRILDSDLFALSTGEEFKAALSLWCKAWLQVPAASLPEDDRVLAHLSGAGTRWKKLKDMALRGWVKCSDGRLYHPVVAEKANEAWKHRLAQRERANKRWGNTGDASSGNPTAHTDAHATASTAAMQGTGTGTVEGKHQAHPSSKNSKASASHAREAPPEANTAALALNYVCDAAAWTPRTDEQRVEALSVVDGWLASGFDLNLDILAGIRQALSRKPERTRSLKRFTSTIRGKHADRQGARLNEGDPAHQQNARDLVSNLASSMRRTP